MEKRLSVSSIQGTQGLIPDSPTDIYLQRLNGWHAVIKKLISYFENTTSSLKAMIDAKLKIENDLKSAKNQIFDAAETFQVLYDNLIGDTIKEIHESSQCCQFIESQILPILESLLAEVRKKATDQDKEWVQVDKEMGVDRDTYTRLVSNLRTALVRIQWKGDSSPASEKDSSLKDPWIVDQLIKAHVTTCEKKQIRYREALIEQGKNMFAFETIIHQNLKVALSLYLEFKTKSLATDLDSKRQLKNLLNQVDIHLDWDKFQVAHQHIFSQATGPLVRKEDLTYDGHDDPLTQIIQEGVFLKKDVGMFKTSWKSFKAILTGSGFFHLFSLEKGQEHDSPVLSLDLSECTVGPLMLNEKEPEEFTISEKSTSIFGREVKHKFKGNDMEISAKWWSLLSDHIRGIKKSIASQQPLIDDSVISSSDTKKTTSQLQKPIQPSTTTNPTTRPTPPRLSKDVNNLNLSSKSPESLKKPIVPLPPRRAGPSVSQPSTNDSGLKSNVSSSSFSVEQPSVQPIPPNFPDLSNPSAMDGSKSAVPLAMQMEMALHAAVEERKSTTVSNPWGEDEDNVWG